MNEWGPPLAVTAEELQKRMTVIDEKLAEIRRPLFFQDMRRGMSSEQMGLVLSERDLPKSSTKVVAVVDAGLARVRVQRRKAQKGQIDGYPMAVTETHYLDGGGTRVAVSETMTVPWYHAEEMRADMAYILPARTKNTVDFGRLTMAAKSLAVTMANFPPGTEISSEQLAIFINGYKNLQEWRRVVREQVLEAEGQIDVVETMLRQMVE